MHHTLVSVRPGAQPGDVQKNPLGILWGRIRFRPPAFSPPQA